MTTTRVVMTTTRVVMTTTRVVMGTTPVVMTTARVVFFFFFGCGQPLVKYRLEYPCQRVPLLLPTRNAGTPKI